MHQKFEGPSASECDVPVPGIFHFFGGIRTGIGKKSRNQYRKNLVPEKVPEPVLEKVGTGKKYRNQYWKNLVPVLFFLRKKYDLFRFIMGIGTVQS